MELSKVIKDAKGNRLVISNWKVELYLVWEQYVKSLWKFEKWKLVVRRNPETHYYHKIWWYGFNNELLQFLKENGNEYMVVEVRIIKSKIIYTSTVKNILEKWQFMYHLIQGFEKQIIMPLSFMDIGVR